MKVAVMMTRFPALSETFILDHITGLIDRGVDVSIFADSPREGEGIHGDVHRYGLIEKTTYLHMPSSKAVRVMKALQILSSRLNRKNLMNKLKLLNTRKYGGEALNLKLLFDGGLHMMNKRFDIVHCHYGTVGRRAIALRDAGVLKGKIITTFLGADISKTRHLRGGKPYAMLFKEGDCFLPVSRSGGERLMALGCERSRIRVQHLGVDCRRLRFCDRSLLPRPPVRLLSVCRLVEKKGIEYAIRAVARVGEMLPQPELEYTIVGDGSLRGDLQKLTRSLQLQDRVKFAGSMDREQVAAEFCRAHIFVLPSHTSSDGDEEGIPVSMMEAMASGLPVLATVHSGIPELVQDGVSGFLVPERDSEALADRLKILLEQPELWAAFGRAGRSHVEEEFNLDRLNDRMLELYHELVAGPPAAALPVRK